MNTPRQLEERKPTHFYEETFCYYKCQQCKKTTTEKCRARNICPSCCLRRLSKIVPLREVEGESQSGRCFAQPATSSGEAGGLIMSRPPAPQVSCGVESLRSDVARLAETNAHGPGSNSINTMGSCGQPEVEQCDLQPIAEQRAMAENPKTVNVGKKPTRPHNSPAGIQPSPISDSESGTLEELPLSCEIDWDAWREAIECDLSSRNLAYYLEHK